MIEDKRKKQEGINKKYKIAFYCIGNFSEFHYYASRHLDFCTSIFYLQNFKGLEFFEAINDNKTEYRYQYEDFSNKFGSCKIDYAINYNVIWGADKSHYKKCSAHYTEKIINTFASIYREWLDLDRPDFIFFPIIESLDAMCLYEVAQTMGIKTIVYSHFRILPFSFLSDNKYEELPTISDVEWNRILNQMNSKRVIDAVNILSAKSEPLTDQMKETIESISECASRCSSITPKYKHPIVRFIKNIKYKLTKEKHNKILNNFVKFQVYIEGFLIPLQRNMFRIIEKLYLNKRIPKSNIVDYNFFALHFSPESSINTPAPYYVDQLRVVDKILLESEKPLVIREHPALYGKRSLSFYRNLYLRPMIYYSSSDENIYSRINDADIVYTVTGTVTIEAFFKNKRFHQFGKNFFSSFEKMAQTRKLINHHDRKKLLISIIFEIGGKFIILPHSENNEKLNKALFSYENIISFRNSLSTHISRGF